MARQFAKKKPDTLYYEVVEERVLYSADGAPGLDLHAYDGQALMNDATRQAASMAQVAPIAPADQAPTGSIKELVIVNPNIGGYEQLIAELQGNDAHRNIEVAILDPDRDGIEQVTDLLAQRSDLAAIHFITHGADGQINLGNGRLDNATLGQNADQIAGWGKSLTESGDILLYGCNVAADSYGQALVDNIARVTGADVAASDNLTGHATQGGDWRLEYSSGGIESGSAVSESAQQTWNHCLANLVVDTTADTLDGDTSSIAALLADKGGDNFISLREAIIAANNTSGEDAIEFGIGTGWQVISLSSDLPTITDQVTIDGWTQGGGGYSGSPLIILDANQQASNGLVLSGAADGSTIRGLVLRDFSGNAIQINAGSDGNTIVGNYIGSFGATGFDLGPAENNAGDGIYIEGAGNTIGGATGDERNVIGGNINGIVFNSAAASGNSVLGNYIGTDAGGITAVANSASGIHIRNDATDNTIGGTTSAAGNIIANNTGAGITVDGSGSSGNSFLCNRITDNTGLGIDLSNDGVTVNDIGDSDTGVNDLQNFPVLGYAVSDTTDTHISGALNSTAGTTFRIEFFSSPSADASGYGEGQTYLGFTTVTTDGTGNANFDITLNGIVVPSGYAVSATATVDLGGGSYGSTSEFGTIIAATANDAPTGVPAITGTAAENQTLTADTSAIADADGLGAFSYQWLRDGSVIAGATAGTYTLGDADVGAQISVQVSYTDGHGTAEGPLTSAQTAAVTNVNDTPTGVPAITGTATEDQTLTVDTSAISDADGLGAFSYQWLRDGSAIAGATAGTYTLGDADVGAQISVQVSYTDGHGTVEGPLTSAQTAPVANVNDAPTGSDNTVTAVEDTSYTFTSSDFGFGDVDGNNLSRVWFTTLPGQGQLMWNGSTFPAGNWVMAADIDAGLLIYAPDANASGPGYTSFTFQVEDDGGTTGGGVNLDPSPNTITIDVTPVNDAPAGLPIITGSATEDQSLTADISGISDADGLGSFSYRWLRDGSIISGATANTYTLGDADVGAQISVQVSYTDGQGTAEGPLTSAQTAPVANINDAPTGVPAITGTAAEDQTLTADTSTIADADGLGAFSYQWLRDGSAIAGATANTYTLGDADVGAQISVQVGYTDGQGANEALVSAPSAAVAPGSIIQGGTGGDNDGLLDEDTSFDDTGTGGNTYTDPGTANDGTLPDYPETEIISDPKVEQNPVQGNDNVFVPALPLEPDDPQHAVPSTNEVTTSGNQKGQDDSREFVHMDDDLKRELYYSKHVNFKSIRDGQATERSMAFNEIDANTQDSKRLELPGNYDLFRQQLDDTFRSHTENQAFKTQLLTFTCTSLTAGVVSYLLKTSSLVASLLSSLPAWRRFDPIAVFAGKKKKRKDPEAGHDAGESRTEAFFDDGEK